MTGYYLYAYDAARILFAAIEAVIITEKEGDFVGRDALREALYATKGYKGITGRLDCDEFGDCAFPRFNIYRLEDPDKGLKGLTSNVIYTFTPN